MVRFITITVLAFFLSGCALFDFFAGDEDDETAQTLAWAGMDHYEEGDYDKSKEAFEKLRDWYPYSDYAKLAELKIADANYKLGNYEEAIFGYEEFESLHPRNEAIPYVIFMSGMCYFEQIGTPDRDQTTAQQALKTFSRLLRDYPNDPYTAKAQEHINACVRSLARAELSIGRFYYKSKHYKAAMRRFKNVLTRYPDVGIHQEALKLITKTETSLAKTSRAGESILPFF